MREFFQGWRRKTGLALLAMALLLTGAWFRSLVVADEVFLFPRRMILAAQSSYGVLRLGAEPQCPFVADKWGMYNTDRRPQQKPCEYFFGSRIESRGILGISLGGHCFMERSYYWLEVQYLVLILPATLGSAALVLWKRPPTTPAKAHKRE